MNLENPGILSQKTAVVTGATKGIGRAIAKSLASAGAKVVITARHEKEIEETVAELGNAAGYVCDVRDYEQVKSVFTEIGGVDILVNNAGIGIFAPVESMSVADFRAVLETNLFGVFLLLS